ncbi:MAG TPA: DUF3095 domain-containing protein [Pseudolabrys sp.]|nr:DUF3095 domain-containing protein [Pseudolabrys sp.]
MDASGNSGDFYEYLPVFRDFTHIADEACFRPLPGDWVVGVADVMGSTKAIRENRYKAVNMAGAAVIASVANALKNRDFPFVFGGDGASFAVPAADAALARQALAETATWVREDLDLTLRIGMVSVGDIRAHGRDVRVARYVPSSNISIAMFSGGGLAWADAAMKRGEIAVPPAPPGSHPDLSGLSCRYELIPSQRGQVLSLVVAPAAGARLEDFRAVVETITRIVEKTPDASRPLSGDRLRLKWPPQGYDLEARASRRAGESVRVRKAKVLAWTFLYFIIMRTGLRVGRFVPAKYTQQVIENSDFRKFDDSLRMVLDCTPELAAEIEDYLKDATARGIARYGAHRQDAAMMTCFTPSPTNPNHVHFIDGAQGGYALAASALKESSTRE